MKRMFTIFMIWRSLPAILLYLSLPGNIKNQIDMDMERFLEKNGVYSLHKLLLFNHVFRRQFMVRVLMESVYKFYLVRLTYKPLESLEISAVTNQIGGGLKILHGYSTIIFCHSMGENCTVYQNVTIGRGKECDGKSVPVIGNNVTIYTGAIVVGGIHIGDNAVIGAGAVVVKDVPANTTVVGQPMRIIKH